MADELKKEKNRRSALKRWIGEDVKRMKLLMSQTVLDRSALLSAYNSFCSRHKAIRGAQAQIEAIMSETDATDEFQKELEYQTSLDEVRAEAEKRLSDDTLIHDVSASTGMSVQAPSNSSSQQIRLPKYSLPTFSGNYVDYISFTESFMCAVAGLDDRNKFFCLREALRPPASEAIAGLSLTSSNFKVAWDILQERYGREGKVCKSSLPRSAVVVPTNPYSYRSPCILR